MLESYGIRKVPTTVKNPQANFVERVHQTLGNMIRTYGFEGIYLDNDDPWSGILAECAWAIRSTVNTTIGATPAQVVFGRDMIFDMSFRVKWKRLKGRRQQAAVENNDKENAKASTLYLPSRRSSTTFTWCVGKEVDAEEGWSLGNRPGVYERNSQESERCGDAEGLYPTDCALPLLMFVRGSE